MGKLVIDLGHGGHDPGAIGPNKTHEVFDFLFLYCLCSICMQQQ